MAIDQQLVSIILPTYNRAPLLQRAIESVFAQSYVNWELIIWDDGSADDTSKVCGSFGGSRIRYIYDVHHGVSFARNRAIERSSGALIAFLDSDDEWLPEKLSQQIDILNKHKEINFLFSDFYNINLTSNQRNTSFVQNQDAINLLRTKHIADHVVIIEDGFLESLACGNYIATDTVILRREILQEIEWFNEDLNNSEDFELWWRMGLAGVRFAYLNQVLMMRHKPVGSLSSLNIENITNHLKALDLCSEASLKHNNNDLLKHLRRPYRNAWHNMITACAVEGDRAGMLHAFRQSLRYGFRPGALRLLWEGWQILNNKSITSSVET